MNESFETALAGFMVAAQETVTASYKQWNAKADPAFVEKWTPKLEMERGKRYVRVVKGDPGQRSAFCFVDSTNGNVLKCAGWKGPTQNFARGNIYAADKGCGRMRWTGVY